MLYLVTSTTLVRWNSTIGVLLIRHSNSSTHTGFKLFSVGQLPLELLFQAQRHCCWPLIQQEMTWGDRSYPRVTWAHMLLAVWTTFSTSRPELAFSVFIHRIFIEFTGRFIRKYLNVRLINGVVGYDSCSIPLLCGDLPRSSPRVTQNSVCLFEVICKT